MLPRERVSAAGRRHAPVGGLSCAAWRARDISFFHSRKPGSRRPLGALASLAVGFLTPGIKLGVKEILNILADTGRGLLDIAIITGLAGVVIGVSH